MTTIDLNFVREDIPKITRAGGSGREAEAWETHLATLKDTPRVAFRVWDYEKRNGALSRMSSVRARLNKAVPTENWTLAVRAIPKTDPVKYGVYVAYEGDYTPEQVAANAKKHAERSAAAQKRAADRAKAATEESTDEVESEETSDEGDTDTPTPKERVKAAASARKAS